MSSSDAIMAWLFDRLVVDVALAGDLQEGRSQGRSTIWYWRQVLIAICTGIWRPIFQHKVLLCVRSPPAALSTASGSFYG